MISHHIDSEAQPYAPEKLERKPDVGAEGVRAISLGRKRIAGFTGEFPCSARSTPTERFASSSCRTA